MKKIPVILNIVLALAVLFFVVYAQIQTKLAEQLTGELDILRTEAVGLAEEARRAAIMAQKAEARALVALEAAEMAMGKLDECEKSN